MIGLLISAYTGGEGDADLPVYSLYAGERCNVVPGIARAELGVSDVDAFRAEGLKVGMIRPISLWPFPEVAFEGIVGKKFLVCELSAGQMVEDVKLSVENKRDVSFFGKLGGTTPSPKVIQHQIKKMG